MRRVLGRILAVLLALMLILVMVTGGAFVYLTRESFPQINGSLHMPGLSGNVTIIRDRFGVPHIYADSPEDLFRAQGYVHAQDRYFQMEFWRRIGQGRLSELFGPSALDEDKFIRTLGWNRTAAAEAARLAPEMKGALEAYAAGVNAYALANPDKLGLEFRILGLIGRQWHPELWLPENSLTWGKAMAWDLGGNMDVELLRAALIAKGGQELAQSVLPPYPSDAPVTVPTKEAGGWGMWDSAPNAQSTIHNPQSEIPNPQSPIPTELLQFSASFAQATGLAHNSEIGSNDWVIGGARTTTGKPILANDPHLGIMMPSIWYQVGLHCRVVSDRCPYDVVGVSFPGVPGVIIGHNNRIAWGVTNVNPDVQDLYIEHANPNNPDEFEYQGKYEPAKIIEEKINVAGQADPVTLRVRVTRHGPIMNDVSSSMKGKDLMALRWTGSDPGTLFGSVLKLDRAQDWDQFRMALSDWDIPAQNFVYADVNGNIGYQMPGRIPVRAKGDGSVPVPGWTGDYEWKGFIPFDRLPTLYNPSEGYIATANNAVVDSKYPYFLGKDWDYGYRIRRIRDMIDAKDKLSVDDVKQMQADTQSLFAQELMPYLKGLNIPNDIVASDALAELRKWDFRATSDSVGTLICEVFWTKLAHNLFDNALGSDLAQRAIGTDTATMAALRNVLADPASHWWRDATNGATNGREQLLINTMRDTAAILKAKLGPDVQQWQWGKLHTVTFVNQTLGKSGIAPIESIFNRGPYAVDGAPGAVDANSGDESMTVTSGPSWRMIVDMSDFRNSRAIHTTGQSGHAFNAHYDDMIGPWLQGQYNPLYYGKDDITANAEGTLALTP